MPNLQTSEIIAFLVPQTIQIRCLRQFTRWCWGWLGRRVNVILPSCAVCKIRHFSYSINIHRIQVSRYLKCIFIAIISMLYNECEFTQKNQEAKLNLLLCLCTATDFSGLLFALHNDASVMERALLCPNLHLCMHSVLHNLQ